MHNTGDSFCSLNLADVFELGRGASKSVERAYHWYSHTALRPDGYGRPEALFHLGRLTRDGLATAPLNAATGSVSAAASAAGAAPAAAASTSSSAVVKPTLVETDTLKGDWKLSWKLFEAAAEAGDDRAQKTMAEVTCFRRARENGVASGSHACVCWVELL